MEEFEQGLLFVTLHGSAEVFSYVNIIQIRNLYKIICNYNFIMIYDNFFLNFSFTMDHLMLWKKLDEPEIQRLFATRIKTSIYQPR